MTLNETRQMGIEFERRIQTIDPTYELINKLDTETIYSFLNEYLDKYVQQLFIASAQLVEDRKLINKAVLSKIQSTLRDTITITSMNADEANNNTVDFEVPTNFMSYIESNSTVSSSYNGKAGQLHNILITEQDFKYLVDFTFDEGRIIRYPLVAIIGDTLKLHHDSYTNIESIKLSYYKKPTWFTILGDAISCELPIECFDDLVTGAVELFFATRYKLGLAQSAQRDRRRRNDNQNDER